MLTKTGIVRRMDDLGRLVVPKELRNTLRWRAGDAMELYIDTQSGMVGYAPLKENISINWGKMGDMTIHLMHSAFCLLDEHKNCQYSTFDNYENIKDKTVIIPFGADGRTYGYLEYIDTDDKDHIALKVATVLGIYLQDK